MYAYNCTMHHLLAWLSEQLVVGLFVDFCSQMSRAGLVIILIIFIIQKLTGGDSVTFDNYKTQLEQDLYKIPKQVGIHFGNSLD